MPVPSAQSARREIRQKAGSRLHSIGGTRLMHEVSDRVCDLDQRNWSRRASRMDHCWDCIGAETGKDVWVT
jgi:hypothetical protein